MNRLPFLLALSSFFIFAGRAYQYIFWDAPLRVLLWDEGLMTPLVTGVFGREWGDYATDLRVVETIGDVQSAIGWWWLLCAGLSLLLLRGYRRWAGVLVGVGVGLLLFHAFLTTKDKFYHLGQLAEFGIQLGTPLLWLLVARTGPWSQKLLLFGKAAVAVTFAGHGLYALGFYPVPANFVDMSIVTLGLTESGARTFLMVAGILDLVVAVAVFLPRADRYALLYATAWGLATALARTVYGWRLEFVDSWEHEYVYQTVFRLPHGVLPLGLYWWVSGVALSASSSGAGAAGAGKVFEGRGKGPQIIS